MKSGGTIPAAGSADTEAPSARAEADWLESVLESAFDAIFVLEAVRNEAGEVRDLRYVLVNPGGERLLGRPAAEILQHDMGHLFPGTRDIGFHQSLIDVIRTGHRLETQFHYDAEGIRGWFRASGVRIGDAVALTVRDVTDDVKKEQALQEREQHLHFITSTTRDVLSLHEADGTVVWVNDTCGEMLGYAPDEIIGTVPEAAIHPDDQPGVARAIDRLISAGEEQTVTARYRHRSGEYVWLQALGRPVTDPLGNVTRFMLSTRGITEQMESHQSLEQALKDLQRANRELTAEKQRSEAAAEAKTRFLATMSHEIRTPLNGIIGIASLLERENFPKHVAELLDTLHASSSALLAIVNDILDFSKLEAGELAVEKRAFPLREVLTEVVAAFRPSAEAKALALELEVASDVPASVVSDRHRIRQILFNLASNAIKFTRRGSVTIRARSNAEDRTLVLEVEDTVIGISETALAKVFRPFSQADVSTTRKYGGTGLGLAIVSSLTTMLGGSLTVKSREKEGTRFRLTLPLEDESSGDFLEDSTMTLSFDEIDDRPLRVLLVEDNAVNRKVAAAMIKRLGHQVEVAVDGIEAVTRIDEGEFDLVLMDLQMPRLDGLGATRQIREKHGPNLPIIALTANAFDTDRQDCLDAGMNGHLTKPLRLTDLEKALNGVEDGALRSS